MTDQNKQVRILKLHNLAIEKFGAHSRIDKAIEECAELLHALVAFKKNPSDLANAMDLLIELADVEIVGPGVALVLNKLHGINFDDFTRAQNSQLLRFEAALK